MAAGDCAIGRVVKGFPAAVTRPYLRHTIDGLPRDPLSPNIRVPGAPLLRHAGNGRQQVRVRAPAGRVTVSAYIPEPELVRPDAWLSAKPGRRRKTPLHPRRPSRQVRAATRSCLGIVSQPSFGIRNRAQRPGFPATQKRKPRALSTGCSGTVRWGAPGTSQTSYILSAPAHCP